MSFGTYQRLRVRVSASDVTVIRVARRKIAKQHRDAPDKRNERKAFYRAMLKHHHEAQELVRTWRL